MPASPEDTTASTRHKLAPLPFAQLPGRKLLLPFRCGMPLFPRRRYGDAIEDTHDRNRRTAGTFGVNNDDLCAYLLSDVHDFCASDS